VNKNSLKSLINDLNLHGNIKKIFSSTQWRQGKVFFQYFRSVFLSAEYVRQILIQTLKFKLFRVNTKQRRSCGEFR